MKTTTTISNTPFPQTNSNVLIGIAVVIILASSGGSIISQLLSNIFGLFSANIVVIFLLFVAIAAIVALALLLFLLGSGGDIGTRLGSKTQRIRFTKTTSAGTTTTKLKESKSKVQVETDSSVEWLNILIEKLLDKFVFSRWDNIREKLILDLNTNPNFPNFLAPVDIHSLEIGNSKPIFHSITATDSEEGFDVDIHFDYEDHDTCIDLSTALILNKPIPNFLSFPIRIRMEDLFFQAKLRLHFDSKMSILSVYFIEKPIIDFLFSNEFGGARKIKNVPKLTALINRFLNGYILDKLIDPHLFTLELDKVLSNVNTTASQQQAVNATHVKGKPTAPNPQQEASPAVKRRVRQLQHEYESEDDQLSDILNAEDSADFNLRRRKI